MEIFQWAISGLRIPLLNLKRFHVKYISQWRAHLCILAWQRIPRYMVNKSKWFPTKSVCHHINIFRERRFLLITFSTLISFSFVRSSFPTASQAPPSLRRPIHTMRIDQNQKRFDYNLKRKKTSILDSRVWIKLTHL